MCPWVEPEVWVVCVEEMTCSPSPEECPGDLEKVGYSVAVYPLLGGVGGDGGRSTTK